ncbi:Phosphofructokinase family protein [Tritrichomonas foetus]|uniref:6-phosphofructokinase n=1 Tax=Tritrichomonas foetus TaxID=1144522 RepID=A0A1J4JZR7_9EUKA|nr:Phosphofructokinase family protein [Tritrichomonas foetus]|eukprot:OHT04657.1 Phosphofructokinase family protein [Tritrichomonas foetus]
MSKLGNIAVVSSGTDNSGINGAIRAVVRTAASKGVKVFGVRWGYRGFIDNQMSILTSRDVSGKIGKAGCFLGTAKPHKVLTDESIQVAIKNCKKQNITGIIVIGGLGSLQTSRKFIEQGMNVIGIPSTIQDDIAGTDISLGVDSAVNNIVKCIDKIRGSSSSRDRTFLVEVEGRECGSLAIRSALVSGADFCLIPERPAKDMTKLTRRMAEFSLKGKNQCLTILSTGWKPGIDELTQFLQEHQHETDLYVRNTVLGYVQRGGAPTGYDRILGTHMGSRAVTELIEGKSGRMVALKGNKIESVPYEEALDQKKVIDPALFTLFKTTRV